MKNQRMPGANTLGILLLNAVIPGKDFLKTE